MKNIRHKNSYFLATIQEWDRYSSHLKKALRKTLLKNELSTVKDAIQQGAVVPVVFDDYKFVAFVEVVYAKDCKIFRVPYAAGKLEDRLDYVLEVFDQLAKKAGCNAIEVPGRKGFERLLRPKKYVFSYIVMTKEV